MGKISSLSAAMNRRHVAEQEHLTALDEFLRFYALPRGMRQQTRMHNTVMSRLFPFRHEAHLVDGMAPPMRRAVLMHVHRHIIQAQPVLKFSSLGFQTRVVECVANRNGRRRAGLRLRGGVPDECSCRPWHVTAITGTCSPRFAWKERTCSCTGR